jgi:hypothetical protein
MHNSGAEPRQCEAIVILPVPQISPSNHARRKKQKHYNKERQVASDKSTNTVLHTAIHIMRSLQTAQKFEIYWRFNGFVLWKNLSHPCEIVDFFLQEVVS